MGTVAPVVKKVSFWVSGQSHLGTIKTIQWRAMLMYDLPCSMPILRGFRQTLPCPVRVHVRGHAMRLPSPSTTSQSFNFCLNLAAVSLPCTYMPWLRRPNRQTGHSGECWRTRPTVSAKAARILSPVDISVLHPGIDKYGD